MALLPWVPTSSTHPTLSWGLVTSGGIQALDSIEWAILSGCVRARLTQSAQKNSNHRPELKGSNNGTLRYSSTRPSRRKLTTSASSTTRWKKEEEGEGMEEGEGRVHGREGG